MEAAKGFSTASQARQPAEQHDAHISRDRFVEEISLNTIAIKPKIKHHAPMPRS
tara:strand:- start:730 stop:891 length:162 start_codon:yes stop_codon:yes gene_type:complete